MPRTSTSPRLNRVAVPILAGCDAGHYTLPASVLAARDSLHRLQDATPPVAAESSVTEQDRLVDALLGAAGSGADWPTTDALMAALHAEEAARAWQVAHARAVEFAEEGLVNSFPTEEIITEHLRPALADTLAGVAKVAPAFEPVRDFSDRQLLAAVPKGRDAAMRLDELAERYGAIRRAFFLVSEGTVQHDTWGIYSEFENLEQMYGNRWPGRQQIDWRPGPKDDPRGRLAWLASGEPKVCLLTPAERDARWLDQYGRGQRAMTPGTDRLLGSSDGDFVIPPGARMQGMADPR